MRQAIIKYDSVNAGILTESDTGEYVFTYNSDYINNHPNQHITFNMHVSNRTYINQRLFPFFDGLIPEGWLLNIAAESWRINKNDRMGLLMVCCQNAIGAVSVHPIKFIENE